MKNLKYDKIRIYFWLNKKSFILATITGILFNTLTVLVPLIQGYLLDLYKAQNDTTYIILFALGFFLFVLFVQANRFCKRYFVRDFANRMVLQMRTVSFDNLLKCDIDEFNKTSKGDIMNKNLADIKDSAEGVRKVLTEIYDSVILMTGYFISMMILDYKTTLIVGAFIILSITISNTLKKLIYKSTSEYKKTFSKSKDLTLNALKNEVYYRGNGVSSNYYKEYENMQNELEKKSIKSMIFKGTLEPIYQAIALIGLFFVVYFSGQKVINNIWLIGTFYSYLSTYMLVSTKASKVGKVFNAATTLKVSWKRCSPYLKSSPIQKDIEISKENSSIEVKDLTFGFDKNFVLHNISFSLDKGNSLAICGMIHSGKSTLGAALTGLYNYEGSVKLYGVELKNVRNELGENFISYLPSQAEIFNDTLKYNISFNKEDDIEKDLKIVCLDQEVSLFPQKENEILSHSLINLSGGQQKRLLIARCIHNNPKLIIMDDPFNAIDIKMSEDITDNILNSCRNSILILINNQKEILQKTNYILFLKNDSYIFGTYEELSKDPQFIKMIGGDLK